MPPPAPTLFTVFTPTYNRAHTLARVHRSLAAQTCTEFEWLVVDDGSTDGTAGLVEQWRSSSAFPIRYLRQPHSGKHTAVNRGVREAAGELFLVLDSDDACVPQALERFRHHWLAIPDAERAGFSAVTSLCVDQHGDLVGSRFPFDPTDSDPLEIRYRYKVTGEKWGFHRTRVLLDHPFPELPDQLYVTESVVWNRIAKSYRTRYVNEPLRIYYTEPGEDSLTRSAADAVARAPMFALSNRQSLDEDLRWFAHAPRAFLRDAANYTRYSLHCGIGPLAQSRALRPPARVLHAVALPVGYLVFLRDRRRRAARVPVRSAPRASVRMRR